MNPPKNSSFTLILTHVSWVRRALRSISALLLMFSLIPAAAAIPAEQILFQPQPYLSALESSGWYTQYPHLLMELVHGWSGWLIPGLIPMIQTLFPPDQTQQIIRFIFPESWVREQTEQLVTHFWVLAFSSTPGEPPLTLNFLPVKTRLRGDDGRVLIQKAFQNLPTCTPQDLLTIAGFALQGKPESPIRCRPPAVLEPLVISGLQSTLQAFINQFPDEVALTRAHPLQGENPSTHGLFRSIRGFLRVSVVSVVLFLTFGFFLARRNITHWVEWAGFPFYVGGLLGAVLSGLAGAGLRWFIEVIAVWLPGSVQEVFLFFGGVIYRVMDQFLLRTAAAEIICALLGLALILISRSRIIHQAE
uniref:Uncharacterized protein n=1 Tax=Anaerolinea thermolimosa TaxID=229919 RepID=A0A7C4KGG4_9CHLR